jgi:hypothetical protein
VRATATAARASKPQQDARAKLAWWALTEARDLAGPFITEGDVWAARRFMQGMMFGLGVEVLEMPTNSGNGHAADILAAASFVLAVEVVQSKGGAS